MKGLRIVGIVIVSSLVFGGCAWQRTFIGGTLGAGGGGVIGGLIGKRAGNTAAGAIIGAAIGGAAGAAIGNYMDRQAAEMQKDLENARVERVGEGIKITFDSGILFAIGSDKLTAQARSNITELAGILNKYEDTDILIEGHTDSTGSESLNLALSENRASSVARQLKSQGVSDARLTTLGYGEDQPIADNGTTLGRQENRRVEVAVFANNKLKRAAKRGTI